MKRADGAYVVAASACTAVGPTAVHTALGVELGIARFAEHPTVHAGDLQPLPLGIVPGVTEVGAERYPWLCRQALSELWEQLQAVAPKGRLPLYLVVPPVCAASERAALKRALEHEFEVSVKDLASGGATAALELVLERGPKHPHEPFLIGAVDSYVDTARASDKGVAMRLFGRGGPGGFLGGEAAAFVCIAPRELTHAFAHVVRVSRIHSTPVALAEVDCGARLAAMLGQVTDGLPDRCIDWWASDSNGERLRSRAYLAMLTRNARWFGNIGQHQMMANATGDIGVASTALLLALAHVRSREQKKQLGLLVASDFVGKAAGCLVDWA